MGLLAKLAGVVEQQQFDQIDKAFKKLNFDYGSYLKTQYGWHTEFAYKQETIGSFSDFKSVASHYVNGTDQSVLSNYLRFFCDKVIIQNFCNQKKPADNPEVWAIFHQITKVTICNGESRSIVLNGTELVITENFYAKPVTIVNGQIDRQNEWVEMLKKA